MSSYFQTWYAHLLISAVFIFAVFALGAYSVATLQASKEGPAGPATISVAGTGEVMATPDIGRFTFSVNAEAADATTAQRESAEAINAIYEYLQGEGVEERDIKTSSYNLYPRYSFIERVCPPGVFCNSGQRVLDGYEVSQSIEVRVRNLDQATQLIGEVGNRGATNISQLSFTIDDESTLKAEARELAIVEAKANAEAIAASLGVRIGEVVEFWEQDSYPPSYFGMERAMMESDMGAAQPALPVGENTIRSQVSLTYRLR